MSRLAIDCEFCTRYLRPQPEATCHHVCRGCGYHDHGVEAGGIYHCPNPLCRICGASWIARGLAQMPDSLGGFTVDGDALHAAQLAHVRRMTDGKLLAWMRERYPVFMADALGGSYVAVVDRDLGDEDRGGTP